MLNIDEKTLENVYAIKLIYALVPLLHPLFKVTIKNSFFASSINAGRSHCR